MSTLEVRDEGKDAVCIAGIDRITLMCLADVPTILAQARSGPARERLYQRIHSTDEKLNEEWKSLVTPDLEHLFASAGETFTKDIEPLRKSQPPKSLRELHIPRSHCDAWLNALNQARVILGAQFEVTEADMDEREFEDPSDPKVQALLRIHVLGYVVQLFVEYLTGQQEA